MAAMQSNLDSGLDAGLHHSLVDFPDLEADNGLEQTGTISRAGELGVLEHLLCDLSIELGAGVAEVALNIYELLDLVKLTVHLQD